MSEPRLRQAAEQFGLDIEPLLASATRTHVRHDQVKYSGVDQTILSQWQGSVDERHDVARIDRSLLGNSHGARVSGAMVTVRNVHQSHPQVILADDKGEVSLPPGRTLAPKLVIVENLENFLNLEGTLALLPACGLNPDWQQSDLMFGSGNSITNHLLTPVFQQYQEIGCLFDPDPGGIRMCDTLYQRGDLPPLNFLAPVDLRERLEASLRNLDMKQRQQLAIHSRRSPPCAHVGGLIRATGKHLEQETYLLPLQSSEIM